MLEALESFNHISEKEFRAQVRIYYHLLTIKFNFQIDKAIDELNRSRIEKRAIEEKKKGEKRELTKGNEFRIICRFKYQLREGNF